MSIFNEDPAEKGFANIEYCPLTLGVVILKLMRKSNKTLEI